MLPPREVVDVEAESLRKVKEKREVANAEARHLREEREVAEAKSKKSSKRTSG